MLSRFSGCAGMFVLAACPAFAVREMLGVDLSFLTDPSSGAAQWNADFEVAVEQGKATEKELSCANLTDMMVAAIKRSTAVFARICVGPTCSPVDDKDEDSVEDELLSNHELLGGFAAEGWHKRCLKTVMAADAVQAAIGEMLEFLDPVLSSGGSPQANARLEEAYQRLTAWQLGTVDLLQDEVHDPSLIFPDDVEDPEVCPQECWKCSRDRGWFKKDAEFAFKCFLKSGAAPPVRTGLECQKPRRDRVRFWRKNTWCEVTDWKLSACQQVRVAAVLTCGSLSMIEALNNPLESDPFGKLDYRFCMQSEQGFSKNYTVGKTHRHEAFISDGVVPTWASLAFENFMTVGLAAGMAALRISTQGQAPNRSRTAANDWEAVLEQFQSRGTENPTFREMYGSSDVTLNCASVANEIIGCVDWFGTLSFRLLLSGFLYSALTSALIVLPIFLVGHFFTAVLGLVKVFEGVLHLPTVREVINIVSGAATLVGTGYIMWWFNKETTTASTRCSIFHHDRRYMIGKNDDSINPY